jgi:hypothetical protein
MNREQLYIDNKYIPLSKSINPSLTKSITDIENPEKRKSTYSKSATITNSPEAQEVFGDIFEINLVDGSFNPTVKTDVRYIVDGEPILEGYLQLKEIIQRDQWEIEYKVVMYGTLSNIFAEMGEEELIDLYEFDIFGSDPPATDEDNSLSRWDHPYTHEIIEYSWDTQVYDQTASPGFFTPFELGLGYVYPLIDYGLTTNLTTWNFNQMGCAIYAKEYIDAIFAKHGFTYTSTFFDSTYFKSLIIPSSPSTYNLTESQILDREHVADDPEFQNGTTKTDNISKTGFSTPEILKFTNEVSDAGGNYNPSTGVYTALNSGWYDFTADIEDLRVEFTPTSGSVVTTSYVEGRFEIFVDGSVVASTPFYVTYDDYPGTFTSGARTTTANPTVTSNNSNIEYADGSSTFWDAVASPVQASITPRTSASDPNRHIVTINNVYVQAGQTVDVRWKAEYRGLNGQINQMFFNGVSYTGGNAKLLITTGTFKSKVYNTQLALGNVLSMENVIPKDIKQKDFFNSIVKMFNLWIDVDPLDNKNFLIEPRNDFLGDTVEDIQELWAIDKDLIIEPVGKLDVTDWEFTYKQDKDYFNDKYEGDYQKIYGNREIKSTNEFVQKTKKIEVIFSPTPIVAPPNSDRVLPTIIELDDLNYPKEIDHNIRILYYGGLIDSAYTWNLTRPLQGWPPLFITDTYSTYPYAGHFDDPYNATEDINWGLVDEVYYDDNLQSITITNNNLVNKYWLNMIGAYTDTNSKIVTGYFNVQPSDFKNWTFDKLYFFNNAYHRLQEISGYNPTDEGLTKCVFLKIEELPAFTPDQDEPIGSTDPIGGFDPDAWGAIDPTETLPVKGTKTKDNVDGNNTSGRGTKIQGGNNVVSPSAFSIEIQGDSNQVFDNAQNIKIQGDSNVIDAGVRNVTLINTSNTTISESNVTYINGVKADTGSISQPTAVEDISSSQDIANDVFTYKVDTSGGDVTLTFPLAGILYTEGQEWNFKKEAAANNLIITVSGGTIDGVTSKTITSDNSNMRVCYNGTGEFIIV